MKNENAILITGNLRCLESTLGSIRRLTENCDIFVSTSVSEKPRETILKDTFGSDVEISYVDDAGPYGMLEGSLSHLARGHVIRQWAKLLHATNAMTRRERASGNKYRCVYKIRTDQTFSDACSLRSADHESQPGTLFMGSDIAFGGARPAFMKAARFPDRLFKRYYGQNRHMQPENFDALALSDAGAGKFMRLAYPKFIGEPETADDLIDRVRHHLPALRGKQFEPSEIFIPHDPHGPDSTIEFVSEPAFAHHVNAMGLICSEHLGLRTVLIASRANSEIIARIRETREIGPSLRFRYVMNQHLSQGLVAEGIELLEAINTLIPDTEIVAQFLEKFRKAAKA